MNLVKILARATIAIIAVTTLTIIGLVIMQTNFALGVAYMTVYGILLALGALAALWWFLPYIPFAIEVLANDPNRNRDEEMHRDYKPSKFGFFTALQPGQVKIIERGDRFVRCIMRHDGHTFAGELDPSIPRNSEEYWENVLSGQQPDFFPIVKPWANDIDDTGQPTSRDPKWWERPLYRWSLRVYQITGYVFTGIYPFQAVRVYPMDQYKIIHGDDGTLTTKVREDFSDHYRVEDFQFPVLTRKADTKDKIPVNILQNFVGRVVNPYEAAYATDDDWSARLMSNVSDAVMSWTRYTPVDHVLSAHDAAGSSALREKVMEIQHTHQTVSDDEEEGIGSYGLKAVNSYILDISATNADDEKKLGELARARVQSDADKVLAEGQAAYVDEMAKVTKENGEDGIRALEVQGRIQTAKAADKNAIVVLGDNPTQQADPLLAALLREIRGKSEDGKETTT